MTTYALITMIENNDNSINNQAGEYIQKRLYESEALICFKHWRKNAGWLKDIPIYTYCPTKNTISKETQEEFKKLNITYIENYVSETDEYFCGYWNVPLAGMILEKTLTEDIFIHIDLDMNIIKPIPKELVDSVINNEFIICGQYDDHCTKQQRLIGEDWSNPFDTGFIISHRESGFYTFFYHALKEITELRGDDRWKTLCSDRPLYDLEEYIIDKAYNENIYPIQPIQKYQIGEWYTPVNKLTDEELEKVYFWHEHILVSPEYNKIQEKIDYFKRTKK